MIPLAVTHQQCNYSSREEYIQNNRNVELGAAYLALGTFYVICYVPCMIVMLKKELWSNKCYKLMFLDGVYDLGTLMANALMPGVIMVIPLDCFCYPNVNQFIMDMWALFWNASCFSTVALAINRLVFLTSPVLWTERLYGGKRVWIWPGAAIVFGLAILIPYRTVYATMIVDTKQGIYVWPEGIDVYGHAITTTTNIVTAVLLFIPYSFTLYTVHKIGQMGHSPQMAQTRRMEQRMLIQVMVICSLTITTCVFYPLAPLLTSDLIFFQLLHFIWITAHGCNGILFLSVNPSIRNSVLAMFGIAPNKVFISRLSTRIAHRAP